MTTGGAGMAAIVAAQKKRAQEHEEEEKLTGYNPDDLGEWEFKIVRSSTNSFKKRETVEQLRREEAAAGWEMVEKFDNSRIRFKRKTDRRAQDAHLPIDPYRTTYGMGDGQVALIIITAIIFFAGAAIALVAILGKLEIL